MDCEDSGLLAMALIIPESTLEKEQNGGNAILMADDGISSVS